MLPQKFSQVHFIGILGIGMSALAQFFSKLGYCVTGSDRDYNSEFTQELCHCLKTYGIKVFPQDASAISEKTSLIIFSTAIEEDNIELANDIKKLHRSDALQLAIKKVGLPQIAVTGSAGKTSVTGWLTCALKSLGKDVLMINGGCVKNFVSSSQYGNFKWGNDIVVFEADESDGSLVNYFCDYAVVLNLSKDHFEESQLEKMFSKFLSQVRKQIFLPENLSRLNERANIIALSQKSYYEASKLKFVFQDKEYKTSQIGYHSVENAVAVLTILHHLGYSNYDELDKAIDSFNGVKRRFDFKGRTSKGCAVYDDYAHNVAKIEVSIKTMQQMKKKTLIVFQPHGYKPLGFMQKELGDMLKNVLDKNTRFCFLEVFYAGGMSSFRPTSKEVVQSFSKKGIKVEYTSRKKIENEILTLEEFNILVIGARDPSLSIWSGSLAV